jgi:hypothetical protein
MQSVLGKIGESATTATGSIEDRTSHRAVREKVRDNSVELCESARTSRLMITHALLQKLPPEASKFRLVDVLTVGSCEQVERFLAEYRERHKVACREWQAWDDHSREWDRTFELS